MPAVRNSKRERFCLYLAQGMRQTMAAKEAGFAVPKTQANKLMRLPGIKARVAELDRMLDLEKVRAVVNVQSPTREFVLRELIENVNAAKAANDRGSVNKGLELIGKEIGMFVQRNMQVDSPLHRLPTDKLSQLLQIIDATLTPDTDRQRPIGAPATVEQIESLTIEGEATRAEEPRDEGW